MDQPPEILVPLSPDDFKAMSKQITEMHTAIFGVDQQGGLHRLVESHSVRITHLEIYKARLVGILSIVTATFTFLGTKIWDYLSK